MVKKKNNITELSVKEIREGNKETTFDFLSYLKVDENNKEILRLIQQIERKKNIIILLERERKRERETETETEREREKEKDKIKPKPVLYRNFPLIGSNEFNMPFIIDGFDFNPLESRSGLF